MHVYCHVSSKYDDKRRFLKARTHRVKIYVFKPICIMLENIGFLVIFVKLLTSFKNCNFIFKLLKTLIFSLSSFKEKKKRGRKPSARGKKTSKVPTLKIKLGKRKRGSSEEDEASNAGSDKDSDAEFEQMLQDTDDPKSKSRYFFPNI